MLNIIEDVKDKAKTEMREISQNHNLICDLLADSKYFCRLKDPGADTHLLI